MKKIILTAIVALTSLAVNAQDLISGGTNSWIFHTPDDGRTYMHIAPKKDGAWDWNKGTQFFNNGRVAFQEVEVWKNMKVNGNIQIGNTGFLFQNGGHKVMKFNPNTTNIGKIRYDLPNKRFAFETEVNGQDKAHFFIHSNGNINIPGKLGIGTSTPDSPLTINGQIHSKEVLVDLDIAPDYVFQKYYTGVSDLKADYSMPSLEEVENFTKANHHLPNVPSAKTLQEDGMHLKEMTTILLQKIEELTLYTIEQEKRIKALEDQLEVKK